MFHIVIRGAAAVFREDDIQVTDPNVLRSLRDVVCEEVFTDYLGGPPEEDAIAGSLERGGIIQFGYDEGNDVLTATTAYRSRRRLTENELRLLVDYTMGQWSDGIGENWTCESASKYGYSIMCLTPGDNVEKDYPLIEVFEEDILTG